jgi:hypothetical protein
LALFYDDVSMTSLVGHGDVTSADVIGEDVAADDRSEGVEVAAQSAVSWTHGGGGYKTWQTGSRRKGGSETVTVTVKALTVTVSRGG